MLSLIKHDILGTDLNKFFPNNAKITKLIQSNEIDWDSLDQRLFSLIGFMNMSYTKDFKHYSVNMVL